MTFNEIPQGQGTSSITFFAVLFLELISKTVCHGEKLLQFSDILPEDSKTYDKMKPPKKDGHPTTVRYHVTVMGLNSINEESMTYAADIFFAQSWKDHRLRLPENMTTDYRLLEVTWLKDIWRPDSFFKNAKSVKFQTMTIPNHYVWLYKDKTILYMVKLTLILSCAMNFATYPHDTQHCSLEMESLHGILILLLCVISIFLIVTCDGDKNTLPLRNISHTTDDLIFDWHEEVPLVVNTDIELPQLDLIETDRKDCTQVYSTGNFTCLKVTFTLKRRLGYYMFHTYIPTCLIVIMSWVSFWIRPEAVPARVTLGVTSLLTLSTQHAKSLSSLPPVSYIKAIDIFMASCTIFVFLSLMEYALVNVLLEKCAAMKLKQKLSCHKFEESLNESDIQKETHIIRVDFQSDEVTSDIQRKQIWATRIDKMSRIFFPLSFLILTCAYWIYYVLCI